MGVCRGSRMHGAGFSMPGFSLPVLSLPSPLSLDAGAHPTLMPAVPVPPGRRVMLGTFPRHLFAHCVHFCGYGKWRAADFANPGRRSRPLKRSTRTTPAQEPRCLGPFQGFNAHDRLDHCDPSRHHYCGASIVKPSHEYAHRALEAPSHPAPARRVALSLGSPA